MMRAQANLAGSLSLLLFAPSPSLGDDFSKAARSASAAAESHRVFRIAVLPFLHLGNPLSRSGSVVAERFTSEIVQAGSLEVAERTLLKKLYEEKGLELSGAFGRESAPELGSLLGVDAILSGTLLDLKGGSLEAHARLIESKTAKVVWAGKLVMDKEWSEFSWTGSSRFGLPSPSLDVSPPSLGDDGDEDISIKDLYCKNLSQRIEKMETSILDLKARYWARRLRDPTFRTGDLKSNPGSEIQNLKLRQEFYSRMRGWYEEVDSPLLTTEEVSRLKRTLRNIESLHRVCRQVEDR